MNAPASTPLESGSAAGPLHAREVDCAVIALTMTALFACGYLVAALIAYDFLCATIFAGCGIVAAAIGLAPLLFSARAFLQGRTKRALGLLLSAAVSIGYTPVALHLVRPLVERHLRHVAHQADVVGAAITAYTADTGAPPASLDALTPKYLLVRPKLDDGCLIYETATSLDATGCEKRTRPHSVTFLAAHATWGLRVRFKQAIGIFYCPTGWCDRRAHYGLWADGEDYSAE